MSFTGQVKQELCAVRPEKKCCAVAQSYGMLLFSGSCAGQGVRYKTEYEDNIRLLAELLKMGCGAEARLLPVGRTRAGTDEAAGMATLSLDEEEYRRVMAGFGYDYPVVSVRLLPQNLTCEECVGAFVRGAFLVCGSVISPEKSYHLEFGMPSYHLAGDMGRLLDETGYPPKTVLRKGSTVLYYKESENIEDLLTLMGATRSAFDLMNLKIVKDIRNNANRVTNCETANIGKSTSAAAEQAAAIRRLEDHMDLDGLPPELGELARARLEHPELSLRDLGRLLAKPLSKSGVSHRMTRLMELADKIED